MSEKYYEALESCLQGLETGADPEAVLSNYPQLADELRPVLVAARAAKSLAAQEVPAKAMARGRARLLGHAARLRGSVVDSSRRPFLWFPRLAASLAVALILILSGTGLVRASTKTLPGDNLYPVKRTWEGMRLLVRFEPASRKILESQLAQLRVEEVMALLAEGRVENISFNGYLIRIEVDEWLVSGIPVLIDDETTLPVQPVTPGVRLMVEGHTNTLGAVEADRVVLLSLLGQPVTTPIPPVETERIDLAPEANGNEAEREASLEDNENNNEDPSNTNDGDKQDDNENNSNENDDSGKKGKDDDPDPPDEPDDD